MAASSKSIAVFLTILLVVCATSPQAAQAQEQPPNPEDVLKNFVIEGSLPEKPLPKIGVLPSLASDIEDVTVNAVVRRDLDLCGEFELLPDSAAPEGLYLSDSAVDVSAWKKNGAEIVVKINGKSLGGGKTELRGIAYFTDAGDKPVYDKRITVKTARVRAESHRIADALIGALTGTPGGFSSQMTFVYGIGKQRRIYVMDSDGHDPTPKSPTSQLALTPVFGPNQQLFYAASVKKGAFKLWSPGADEPMKVEPRGSIYGIAFNRKRDQVAVSIARGAGIKLFHGASDFSDLKEATTVGMAMHPAWSSTGKLAFSGAGKWGQRIYVDGKAVTPAGLNATAPIFCRHPNGIRLIYMVWLGERADLVAMGETGGGAYRLTGGMAKNSYPACSPDGRMIAFFSTRKSGQGPGLYVMRIDGRRPKRISTLVGDSLRWARLPKR
jgi:TolB protein